MRHTTPHWNRGPCGYARLIGLLSSGPLSTPAIRAAFGMELWNSHLGVTLRGLQTQGLVQRVGSEKTNPGAKGKPHTVWALGGTQDKARCRVEMIAFGHFMRTLHAGPVTVHELIAASGFCRRTINRLLKQMYRDGMAHVGGWDRIAHLPAPAFVYGPGANQPRPKPTPQAVISRRWAEAQLAKREQMQMLSALAANAGGFARCAGGSLL